MSLKLNGAESGSIELDVPAAIGSDLNITIPGAAGTLDRLERAGNILQVQSVTKTDTSTFSLNTSWSSDVPGLQVNITPSSTSSKILLMGFISFSSSDTLQNGINYSLERDNTSIQIGDAGNSNARVSGGGYYSPDDNRLCQSIPINFLDSPSSTSQLTYGIKIHQPFSANIDVYINLNGSGVTGTNRSRATSTLTAIEVAQ